MANLSNRQTHTTISMTIDELATQFLNKFLRHKRTPMRRSESQTQSKPPWEDWELDKDFFKALSKWTAENPERSLDRVLHNISNGLENNKDLLQLIPDAPFPARGLVTALAHLFKLGVKVSRAKRDVQIFAKDVVRWVEQVKTAFESPGDGRFTRLAWRNLKDMRTLVNEICTWAVKRLTDGTWWQIGHGLAIQNEIQEFNTRLSDARALFKDLSLISQAKGLDLIMKNLQLSFDRQGVIISEIEKIRKTQEKQFNQIIDEIETQKQVAERERFLAQTLNVHTVADPTYDSQGKRPCDEDTRIEVLKEIRRWKNDTKSGSPNFLWLTGDPGCGKSAVTASLARECKDQRTLWAQFFINRNNVETTNPKSYFPSIARQLASRSPEVAEAIHQILKKQLSLLDDISADQAAKLFTDSIRHASKLHPDQPVVVIIDGLDETNRDRLEFTAKVFSTLFTSLEAYRNVKFFISSRTENEIQKSFIRPSNDRYVKRVHLDIADPTSIRDVSYYIKRNLLDLVSKHDLNWEVWPGDERTRALGERASGLFIWGVTAMKFIEEQLNSHGEECLDDLLNMLTADVLHGINSLYQLILTVTHGQSQDEWEIERFRRIVGAIVCLQEPLSLGDLAILLDLRKTPSSKPADIVRFVRRFRTILVAGTDTIDENTIPRIHKSVFEFVTSKSVDARFRVEVDHAHVELGMQCLVYFGTFRESVHKDTLPVPFRYAALFWKPHLSQTSLSDSTVCAEYSSTTPSSPSFGPVHSGRSPLRVRYSAPASQITTTVDTAEPTIWNAFTGACVSRHTREVTCLVFSPDGKQIVSCSRDKTIKIWDTGTGKLIRTLVNYSSDFRAVALSSDGKLLVSGSDDGLVRLWDYSTGAPVGRPFRRHESGVTCVGFSPDMEEIISGSNDGTCIIWNRRDGRMVGKHWAGNIETDDSHYREGAYGDRDVRMYAVDGRPIVRAGFSSSGQKAFSVDNAGCLFIWSVNSRRTIHSYNWDPNSCFSFSPMGDDDFAVGGKLSLFLRLGDYEWSNPTPRHILCTSFSPDGEDVFYATNGTIYAASVEHNDGSHRLRQGDYHHSSDVQLMALSPDLDYFALANSMKEIHVYTLRHGGTSIRTAKQTRLPPKNTGENLKLPDTLYNMDEVQLNYNTANNSRLNTIKWCKRGSDNGAIDSDVKLCVLKDASLIAGYKDGSIIVWERERLLQNTPSPTGPKAPYRVM